MVYIPIYRLQLQKLRFQILYILIHASKSSSNLKFYEMHKFFNNYAARDDDMLFFLYSYFY